MVDRSVGLDRVGDDELGGQGVDRAVHGGDDPRCERIGVPEGASDRGHGLADEDARGVPERHRSDPMRARIDLQDADVVEDVPPDDPRESPVAVGELDVDVVRRADAAALAGVRDHVRAREDVAAPRDDEAGPLRGLRRRLLVPEERVDRHDARRPPLVQLGRVEAVPDQRLGSRVRDRLRRHRPGLRLRGHDHGVGRRGADPAHSTADRERCDCAEAGAEEGDRGEPGRAHAAAAL